MFDGVWRYAPPAQLAPWAGRVIGDEQFMPYGEFPFCEFEDLKNVKTGTDDSFGAKMVGMELSKEVRMNTTFGGEADPKFLCQLLVTSDIYRYYKHLIEHKAAVEYWVDGIYVLGQVGTQESIDGIDTAIVFTERRFTIEYISVGENEYQVTAVNLEPRQPTRLELNSTIDLFYSYGFTEVTQVEDQKFRYEAMFPVSSRLRHQMNLGAVNSIAAAVFGAVVVSLTAAKTIKVTDMRQNEEMLQPSFLPASMRFHFLRKQLSRRPTNAILQSVVISLGCQAITALMIFTAMVYFLEDGESYRKMQLDGRMWDNAVIAMVFGALGGGLGGGCYIKNWGVRRKNMAALVQAGGPYLLVATLSLQLRTAAAVKRSGATWPISLMYQMAFLGLLCLVLHFIGFAVGWKLGSNLEFKPLVAGTPSKARENRMTEDDRMDLSKIRYVMIFMPAMAFIFSAFPSLTLLLGCSSEFSCAMPPLPLPFVFAGAIALHVVVTLLVACGAISDGDPRWQLCIFKCSFIAGTLTATTIFFEVCAAGRLTGVSLLTQSWWATIIIFVSMMVVTILTAAGNFAFSCFLDAVLDRRYNE